MTDTLVQFLRARLKEDEETSRAATPGPWAQSGIGEYGWGVTFDRPGSGVEADDSDQGRADADHIARHDPTRILREVEAKRLLLEQAVTSRHLVTGDQFMDCPLVTEADGADADHVERIQALNDMYREELGREPSCIETCGRDARVRRTLELLAMPYSDHPGYAQTLAANRA